MNSADARQGALGALAALFSMVLVIGSLALSITEGGWHLAYAPTPEATKTPVNLFTQPSESLSTQAATSMVTPVVSPTLLPSLLVTPSPPPPTPPSSCPPPEGWSPVTIQPGDSLTSLSDTYNISEQDLAQANCLVTNALKAGTTLYVPGIATPPPPIVCGPPPGWVFYIVQPGDNLYKLSLIYGVSIAQLQSANCLGTSTYIRIGQRLYVPYYIAPTATPTATQIPVLTSTATPTVVPTNTATLLPTKTPTLPVGFTAAPTTTFTSTSTPTATNTPTATPTATATASPTATDTATTTPSPPTNYSPTPTATVKPEIGPSP